MHAPLHNRIQRIDGEDPIPRIHPYNSYHSLPSSVASLVILRKKKAFTSSSSQSFKYLSKQGFQWPLPPGSSLTSTTYASFEEAKAKKKGKSYKKVHPYITYFSKTSPPNLFFTSKATPLLSRSHRFLMLFQTPTSYLSLTLRKHHSPPLHTFP